MKLAFPLLSLCLLFYSTISFAHDVSLITQHITLTKQNESGWQHDVLGRAVISRKLDVGLQGTYLERFDRYEKRYGGFLMYHPTHALTIEAGYLLGDEDNELLPRNQFDLTAYYALTPGYTPYLIFRDQRYSVTHVDTLQLGVEIEKIRNLIFIPSFMVGNATFERPAETKGVNSVGLRVMYYREKNYSLFVYGAKGKEAAQGIIGRSNTLVDTLTGGLGGGYFFRENLQARLSVDHTDYEELKTQFITTTLNLRWIF